MSDTSESSGAGGTANKGQGLVAAFRAARISQRPALKTELRNSRAALRQDRLDRLGKHPPQTPAPAAQSDAPPDEATAKADPAPAPATGPSIFATFMDRTEDVAAPAAEPPPPQAPTAAEPVAHQADPAAPEPAPATAAPAPAPTQPPPRVPLSAIGFGPGMMIRMSHLGIESIQQLAEADPVWLRGALGDVSRLINVELWIASARNACAQAA
jgi:predicted flap endonuclease-1-like 5' DNA nuclease